MPQLWWCNLGKSYDATRRRGELWAGTSVWHHKTMEALEPGDIVLTAASGQIPSFATVSEPARRIPNPDATSAAASERLVARVQFEDLPQPVKVSSIDPDWKARHTVADKGPFLESGKLHQLFLCPIQDLPTSSLKGFLVGRGL